MSPGSFRHDAMCDLFALSAQSCTVMEWVVLLEAASGNRLSSLRSARDLLASSGFTVRKTSGVYEIAEGGNASPPALGVCLLVAATGEKTFPSDVLSAVLCQAGERLSCVLKCTVLASPDDKEAFLSRSALRKDTALFVPFLEVLPDWFSVADIPEQTPRSSPEPEELVFISVL